LCAKRLGFLKMQRIWKRFRPEETTTLKESLRARTRNARDNKNNKNNNNVERSRRTDGDDAVVFSL
jgi:hypothetical protein